MSYVRKTFDTWDTQGDYGTGFETVDASETWQGARESLKTYRENEPGVPFRIKKVRNRIETAHPTRGPVPRTLYAVLVAAGCEIDSHESDLYVKSTPTARDILSTPEFSKVARSHFSDDAGAAWFDIPFYYAPFWGRQ